jgi:hypothetical protein
MDPTIVERDVTDEDLALVGQARITGWCITIMPPCR